MADWVIVEGPEEYHDRDPGEMTWKYVIERSGERRNITIRMSDTLHWSTAHPSHDAAEARETKGRNYVEAVLHMDDPPRRRRANTELTAPDELNDEWDP